MSFWSVNFQSAKFTKHPDFFLITFYFSNLLGTRFWKNLVWKDPRGERCGVCVRPSALWLPEYFPSHIKWANMINFLKIWTQVSFSLTRIWITSNSATFAYNFIYILRISWYILVSKKINGKLSFTHNSIFVLW